MNALPLAAFGLVDGLAVFLLVTLVPVSWWLLWRMWRHEEVRFAPNSPYSPRQRLRLAQLLPTARSAPPQPP